MVFWIIGIEMLLIHVAGLWSLVHLRALSLACEYIFLQIYISNQDHWQETGQIWKNLINVSCLYCKMLKILEKKILFLGAGELPVKIYLVLYLQA